MNNEVKTIPYIVYESTVDRLERVCRRLWMLCIIIFICFVASNAFWIWYDGQFQDETTITQEVDTGEGNAIVNGTGNLNYGEGQTDNHKTPCEKNGR